jgi:phenylacetate-CoA ligase
MAAEAKKAGIDLARSAVRITIHAGEPGASIPSTKKLIEDSWGAKCFDHAGATEVGAFGFQCESQPGSIHINENEFIAEVIDPATGVAVKDGDRGELVITNLGRIGSPVIRYRINDLVEPNYQPCSCGEPYMLLRGGVLGRVDDMVIVRGVNIFPSAIESVLREFSEIEEFRVEILESSAMKEMKIVIDPGASGNASEELGERVGRRVRERIGLRPVIELAAPGSLPRFELKARRFFRV